MYVINTQTHIVNKWADSEINRQRLASGKYGVIEYTGEIETVDCIIYEKGYAPEKTLEEAKTAKLAELNAAFESAAKTAHCLSSVGFEINADESANRNISSLIIAMEATGEETVQFCAYDNSFHEVTLAQLKTMQLEIIANAQAIYQRKWELREQINGTETIEELEAIDITFGDDDGQTA